MKKFHPDFPSGQVTFHSHLSNRQGPGQAVCLLNEKKRYAKTCPQQAKLTSCLSKGLAGIQFFFQALLTYPYIAFWKLFLLKRRKLKQPSSNSYIVVTAIVVLVRQWDERWPYWICAKVTIHCQWSHLAAYFQLCKEADKQYIEMCQCFSSLDRDGCSSLKLFSTAFRWSENPLLPLLKELGPAEVGVSLLRKKSYHYRNCLI